MDETIARISKYNPELGASLAAQYEEFQNREALNDMLAEQAEADARLASWQAVEFDA
jgi:Asp-tRNA(Asn)/Glu-tRNA(Gln) amidotransferase A subunit family amidase